MKKVLAFFLGLMMISTITHADQESDSSAGLYLGLATAADFPGTNYPSGWPIGLGGEISIAYMFNQNLGLQLDFDHFTSHQPGLTYLQGEYTLNFKYILGQSKIQPYAFAGGGLYKLTTTGAGSKGVFSGTACDFDFDFGAGVQLDLGKKLFLFLEGKYNGVLPNGNTTADFPLLAGISFKL